MITLVFSPLCTILHTTVQNKISFYKKSPQLRICLYFIYLKLVSYVKSLKKAADRDPRYEIGLKLPNSSPKAIYVYISSSTIYTDFIFWHTLQILYALVYLTLKSIFIFKICIFLTFMLINVQKLISPKTVEVQDLFMSLQHLGYFTLSSSWKIEEKMPERKERQIYRALSTGKLALTANRAVICR